MRLKAVANYLSRQGSGLETWATKGNFRKKVLDIFLRQVRALPSCEGGGYKKQREKTRKGKILWKLFYGHLFIPIGLGVVGLSIFILTVIKSPEHKVFFRNLFRSKEESGQQTGTPTNPASDPASSSTPTEGVSSGMSLENWQIFLLVFVCGEALALLMAFIGYKAQMNLGLIIPVVHLIAYTCGVAAFLTSKNKALSAIRIPCAIAAGLCAVCELFFLIR
jgi:hypothetical protein